MISRPYFPWISLAKARKPKKNNEKKPLPIPTNRFLGKFANPIPEQFSVFSESFRNGIGNKQIGVCENNSRDWQEGRYEMATTIEKSLER